MKSKFYLPFRLGSAFITLLLLSSTTFAQYSQWVYSPSLSSTEGADNGVVLKFVPGHIMCGVTQQANSKSVYIVKNDLTGNSTTVPYFNKVINVGSPGGQLRIQSAKIVELKNNGNYAVGGVGEAPSGTYYLFYFRLNALGNLVGTPSVYNIGGWSPILEFGGITEDAAGTFLYLTGGIRNIPFSSTSGFFVHKIDQTGAINWSNVYPVSYISSTGTSITKAYGLVEEPSGNEIAVIGTLNYKSEDGFFTRINAATGIPFGYWVDLFGGVSSDERLFSITNSASDPAGNPRYLVAGMSNVIAPTGFNAWIMLLTQGGFKIWSTVVDDDIRGTNGVFQVIERPNTSGVLEYYTAGATAGGPFGGVDGQLIKGNVATGMPLTCHVYGGAGNDFLGSLDYENGPSGTGLAMFGRTASFTPISGTEEMYFIKAYFNGEVGCNVQEQPVIYQSPLDRREILDMTVFGHFAGTPSSMNEAAGTENNLCLDASLPLGDNAMVAQPKQDVAKAGNTTLKFTPNPATQSTSTLLVDVDAPAGATMSITVTDMLGRQFLATSIVAEKSGKQQMPVSIESAGLAPGMYMVKLWAVGQQRSSVLLVK